MIEKDFKCEILRDEQEIEVFHATSSLERHLQDGYIGGDRDIHLGLSIKDKDYLLNYVKNREQFKKPEERTIDYGFIKTKADIDNLFVDWESELVPNIISKDIDVSEQSFRIIGKILGGRYENKIPLRKLFSVCKEVGDEYFIDNTWVVYRGNKIKISKDNLI